MKDCKNMKKFQKLIAISLLLLAVQQIVRANGPVEDESEWITEPNEKYLYNKTVTYKPAKSFFGLFNNQVEKTVDIKLSNHIFDSGITRTKTTIEPLGELIRTTVENWITADPSYLTWLNKALAAGLIVNTYRALKRSDNFYDDYNAKGSLHRLADDPFETLLVSGSVYYLYRQYLKDQKAAQDKKTADLDKEIEKIDKNQDQKKS